MALALWLSTVGAAGAASGTPWHSGSAAPTGAMLPVWQLWVNALDPGAWTQEEQSWVPSSPPWLVAPHPSDASRALAAGPLGLHRTTDGGATWTRVPGIVAPVLAIAYNALNPQVVYAGTELGGIYRSADGGRYWRRIDAGLPRDRLGHVAGAVALAADPNRSYTLYAATTLSGGLYRSLDDGSAWSLASAGLPEDPLLGLAVTASGPTRLYAATPRGLFLSTDRGGQWSLLGALPLEAPPSSQTQTSSQTPTPSQTPHKLLVEPEASGQGMLLVAAAALYRSTNGGVSWVTIDLPAAMPPIRDAVFVAGPAYTHLFVAGADGPYWQRFTPASPQSPPGASAGAQTDTAFYVAVTGHTIREPFLSYFALHGGVARFGYPRTDAVSEDGKTVQYFQRARLEIVTDEVGERVARSPLGALLRFGASSAAGRESSNGSQMQYAVDQVFANFYASNNGRESFGRPLGPAADEEQRNGHTVYTQYFEFARLEHYPNAETPVLLGLIGDEYLIRKGWLE